LADTIPFSLNLSLSPAQPKPEISLSFFYFALIDLRALSKAWGV
jgi:hypothetical protein